MGIRQHYKSLWGGIVISYKVFNTLTGQYENAASFEEAKTLRTELINNYFIYQGMFQNVPIPNFFASQKAIASEFLAVKLGIAEVKYAYTNYNASTKQDISQVFFALEDATKSYLIKVENDAVTEWYETNVEVNGAVRSWASLDLNTDTPIEYYVLQGNTANWKYNLAGEFIVATNFCSGVEGIPQDKLSLLDDFSYKDKIVAWSDKYYGFIVEYTVPESKPLSQATPEELAAIEEQKRLFVANNPELFVVNEVTIDGNGNETWAVKAPEEL